MHQPISANKSVTSFADSCISKAKTLIIIMCSLSTVGAWQAVQAQQSADPGKLRNHVHLSVSGQRVVVNEEIRVTLATEHRGRNPTELAQLANEDLAWATDLIAKKKSVSVATGSYQTFPMYEQKRQEKPTWQLVQEVVIRSESFSDVTELLGQLQTRLQIRGTQFFVTPATRRSVENELIEEAMAAFHDRAAVIGRSMPSSQYEIVNINVDTGTSGRPDHRMQRNVAAMETMPMESSVVAPTVAAGQATIAVHIRGSVVYP